MPRELVNANITHVSYVDKGANQKQFFFTKSDKQPDFKKEVKLFINKEDEEQQLVYGVVYEPDVEDSHGDFMTAPEIEKSAHGFMKDARNIDKQHDFESGVGEVVESYIAPADFNIGEHEITKGSWVLVTKATDEIWEEIKKGEITGYSMAGTAETIEKQNRKQNKKPVSKSENDEEMKGFFNLLKSFFTKGEVRDSYESNQQRLNLWAVWDGLEDTYYESLWNNNTAEVTDFERLLEGVQEFAEILQEIRDSGDIQKALENKPETIGKGDEIVKAEDFKKALEEALQPINDRLESIEKEVNPEAAEPLKKDDAAGGEDSQLETFKSVLKEALDPISTRLETVEKARGVSKQADQDDDKKEPVQKHYLSGIL
ncbi:XkdF-like putative serine protease domain-containing protein [Siminovitchia terrae]|uniref:XkdF-like putative serine protease domain-containing protein n=1 Tax=Siminovitchia terrae TaxID=1914933 RepID=UPI0028A5D02E|nr:XkdF-like putative serine protease domain-containing protein [Siminovitchia terrae]